MATTSPLVFEGETVDKGKKETCANMRSSAQSPRPGPSDDAGDAAVD